VKVITTSNENDDNDNSKDNVYIYIYNLTKNCHPKKRKKLKFLSDILLLKKNFHSLFSLNILFTFLNGGKVMPHLLSEVSQPYFFLTMDALCKSLITIYQTCTYY